MDLTKNNTSLTVQIMFNYGGRSAIVNALKSSGLKNVFMTGCPAWYDLVNVEKTELNPTISQEPKIIAISDPAIPSNFNSAVKITEFLSKKYPDAQIKYVLHRGKNCVEKSFKRYLDAVSSIRNVTVYDISDGFDGFAIYDTCDLHIGFRVHAHIYNLSKRNRTILIEEDGRGSGVNEALGLISIKAYNDQFMIEIVNRILRKMNSIMSNYGFKQSFLNSVRNNSELNLEIDTYLDILKATNNLYLKNAFHLQKTYYQNMKNFVLKLNSKY